MKEMTVEFTTSDVIDRLATASRRSVWAILLSLVAVFAGAAAIVAASGPHARAAPVVGTHKVFLRPVTASGHAADGYRVVTERGAVECRSRSPYAVDAGIASCGGTADHLPACWASARKGRVLCLRDPFRHELMSLPLSGAFPATREPRHALPQALTLTDHTRYLVRIGGGSSTLRQHRSWPVCYYQRPPGTHAIYGPSGSHGISRKYSSWVVTTWTSPTARGVRHHVGTAFYVGAGR